MCGIAGYLALEAGRTVPSAWIRPMCDALRPRGPDGEGYHMAPGVVLGHRRLSVIDIAGGAQPMKSADGTKVLVCNGEVYNYVELRDELRTKGRVFRTQSDTEVVLAAYEAWGPPCVERFNGMFAFALWDGAERRLFCARDRFGKKPFFYAVVDGIFVFASEMKALLRVPGLDRGIDHEALAKYLALDFVPAPRTLFRHISKLPGGFRLTVAAGRVEVQRYWDLPAKKAAQPAGTDVPSAIAETLAVASRRRLVSDVPLGLLLSGGLDSSSISAVLQGARSGGLDTFCLDFAERSYSEGTFARRVAEVTGARHHEERLDAKKLQDLVPIVSALFDDPVSDPSFLPTYVLCQFSRERVTVALGGDGGDELLAGYPTYLAHRLSGPYLAMPRWLRDGLVEPVVRRLPSSGRYLGLDVRAQRFVEGVKYPPPIRSYIWNGSFSPPRLRAIMAEPPPGGLSTEAVYAEVFDHFDRCPSEDFMDRQLYLDMKLYLQEKVLVKVDRCSMAHSLEVRAPFLDVEFAQMVWRIPAKLKCGIFRTKPLLRDAMKGRLPREILRRPKKGFAVPLAMWFRGGLRPWLKETLSPDRLRRHGLLRAEEVHDLIRQHASAQADHAKRLWNLLTFQLWWERYASGG